MGIKDVNDNELQKVCFACLQPLTIEQMKDGFCAECREVIDTQDQELTEFESIG